MTLFEIRNLFVERSGRYDLQNEDMTDNGADFFIQAGVRFLDKGVQHLKSSATCFGTVSAQAFKFLFTRCRAVKEVWVSDAVARTKLQFLTAPEFYTAFAGLANSVAVTRPAYYTLINLRATELTAFNSLGQFIQHVQVDDATYNGIVFNPTDANYVIEIVGLFESTFLTLSTDTNFWTINYPDLLLMAALYKLEIFNRNTTGANDWLSGINQELSALEMDMIEQEVLGEDLR
jgi:hypothetical protein